MVKRALVERRPYLLASLLVAITYWFVAGSALPGLYQIVWKGAGVTLLAAYAVLRHPSVDARLLGVVMLLSALGDMALELDQRFGVALFFASHLAAIALYARHRRTDPAFSQKALAVALLIVVPLLAYTFPADRSLAIPTALYGLALAGMAASAWTSIFPRYRVGLGALLFVASDLLIFAQLGPLATSGLAQALIWPLYYLGQFLICTGVIQTLYRRSTD